MNSFSSVALTSRIRLARNISDVEFMPLLRDENKIEYITSSMKAVLSSSGDFAVTPLSEMSLNQCTSLLERHLISKELIANKDISQVGINEDESIVVMILEEDHLRLQSIMEGFSLVEAYNKLLPLDEKILSSFKIAYDENLGFLTSSPSNLGSGMRASVMVFIPALVMSGRIDELRTEARKEGLTFRGVYGEGSAGQGYIYQISNQGLLSLSEEELIDRVSDFFFNVFHEETSLREQLFEKNQDEITDKVFRAYGTILNAYTLEEGEMFELLGLIRFGQELGLMKIKDKQKFMKLYYHGGSAFLKSLRSFSEEKKENTLRAEYISRMVKNLVTKGGEK